MNNEMRTIFAGFGGQGLLFAGKVMAYAGLLENKEVSWMPSYGPEMRGGTANCSVTLSDEPIGSPLITDPTAVIVMNRPSLARFEKTVVPGGIILIDSTLVHDEVAREDVQVYKVPATDLAQEVGNKSLANIVLLGKLHSLTDFCAAETIPAAMRKCISARKAALCDLNIEAFEAGRKA